jgi:hypothetical protein
MADLLISSISSKDISDARLDIAVAKIKCPVTLIRDPQGNAVTFSLELTMKRQGSRRAPAAKILRS